MLRSVVVAFAFLVIVCSGKAINDQHRNSTFLKFMGSVDIYANGLPNRKEIYINRKLKLDWAEALMFCRYFKMDLLTIETEDEQQEIFEMILQKVSLPKSPESFFVAATDENSESNFQWIQNGELKPVDYNLKLNSSTTGSCLTLQKSNDTIKFQRSECEEKRNFICQNLILNPVNKVIADFKVDEGRSVIPNLNLPILGNTNDILAKKVPIVLWDAITYLASIIVQV